MRIKWSKNNRVISFLFIMTIGIINAQNSTFQEKSKFNQFDFWLGEWDVNLRVKQSDNSWKDNHKSIARIYPVLDGKAVLELWEEQGREKGIIGYSLRYYDSKKDKWILWLNWPRPNDSGSVKLEGDFRHGRVEFFGSHASNDSTNMKFRYTFSDITENSLRWDNAMSMDDGKSWSGNWIMEFSRRKDKAPELISQSKNLTYSIENRCDLPEFELIKSLASRAPYLKNDKKMEWFGILEGCAVMSLMKVGEYEELSVLTYSTDENKYEELVFSTKKQSAILFYGNLIDDRLEMTAESEPRAIRKIKITPEKYHLKIEDIKGEKIYSF